MTYEEKIDLMVREGVMTQEERIIGDERITVPVTIRWTRVSTEIGDLGRNIAKLEKVINSNPGDIWTVGAVRAVIAVGTLVSMIKENPSVIDKIKKDTISQIAKYALDKDFALFAMKKRVEMESYDAYKVYVLKEIAEGAEHKEVSLSALHEIAKFDPKGAASLLEGLYRAEERYQETKYCDFNKSPKPKFKETTELAAALWRTKEKDGELMDARIKPPKRKHAPKRRSRLNPGLRRKLSVKG